MLTGSLGIAISIGVGTTVLGAVIAVLLVRCYLNWKRQYRKQKTPSNSADGTVQQLVLQSQPVDFIPLLIQEQLEEDEENEVENTLYISGTSSEDLTLNQSRDKTDSKVR